MAHPGHGDFYPEEIESPSSNVKDTSSDSGPVKSSPNSKYGGERYSSANNVKSSDKSSSSVKTDSNENNENNNKLDDSTDLNNTSDIHNNQSDVDNNVTGMNLNLQTGLILVLVFFIGFGAIIGISKLRK